MATNPNSGISLVVDASVFVRALIDKQEAARRWTEEAANTLPAWPVHLYVEVANSLVTLVRAGIVSRELAADVFDHVRLWRAQTFAAARLHAAMSVALERQLSVYDAAYVVLAEALDVPLVTADRRLAAATATAVLV